MKFQIEIRFFTEFKLSIMSSQPSPKIAAKTLDPTANNFSSNKTAAFSFVLLIQRDYNAKPLETVIRNAGAGKEIYF